MAKCTGIRRQMQAGCKVDECDYKDCPWRTEPITNADRIRDMSDDELTDFLNHWADFKAWKRDPGATKDWLQQPAETSSE